MAFFAPLPGTYVVLRINAVASVEEFGAPALLAIAKNLNTKPYVALLSCVSCGLVLLLYFHSQLLMFVACIQMHHLPFQNLSTIQFQAEFVGHGLPPNTAKGHTPDMCTPIFPALHHPKLRVPLRPMPEFPLENSYQWSRCRSAVRIRTQRFDQSRAVALSFEDLQRLEKYVEEDNKKREVVHAHAHAKEVGERSGPSVNLNETDEPVLFPLTPRRPAHIYDQKPLPRKPRPQTQTINRYILTDLPSDTGTESRPSSTTHSLAASGSGRASTRIDSLFDTDDDADSVTSRAHSQGGPGAGTGAPSSVRFPPLSPSASISGSAAASTLARDRARARAHAYTQSQSQKHAHAQEVPTLHTQGTGSASAFVPIVEISFDLSRVADVHDPRGFQDEVLTLRR